MSFQYYIDVVQTDINLLLQKSKTFQYSVKNYARVIDHNKGSHGIPGIFVQYDTSSLKVTVSQQRDSVVQFLVKLCATIGGIYVTNGNSKTKTKNRIKSCYAFFKQLKFVFFLFRFRFVKHDIPSCD